MGIFKTMKWSALISGILLVLLGILTLVSPGLNLVWLALIISIAVLIFGISELIDYFTSDKAERTGWQLAEAIISTVIGIWMVFGSGSSALTTLIPYLFAVFVFISGIVRIVESFEWKRLGSREWGWQLFFGILSILLGILLFLSPMISATFITIALSLLLIAYGISNIVRYVNMQRVGNHVRRRIREIEEIIDEVSDDEAGL